MDQLLEQINVLFALGGASEFEFRRLEKFAQQALEHADSAAEGYMALGLLAALRFDTKTAYGFFEKSRHLSPYDPLLLANYAKAQNFLADAEGAMKTMALAIKTAAVSSIIEQGVYIALSALQIKQAQQWQAMLDHPILVIPDNWVSIHQTYLNTLGLTADDLTHYRDRMAAVLVQNHHPTDQGQMTLRDDGSLLYRFELQKAFAADIDKLNAIDCGFAAVAGGAEAKAVGFLCGLPSQNRLMPRPLLASFDTSRLR